jgi:methylthioribulose-1-phosphate dehydratase
MKFTELKEELAQTIRALNIKGWSPATSTNYSFRDDEGQIWVSRSGVDKSNFLASDFITIDQDGNANGEFVGVKPSAETLIHCIIYALFPQTKVILHSHGVYPIVATANSQSTIVFEGYEVQKGFAGQTTHDAKVEIPVFDNTQDMTDFASKCFALQLSFIHHAQARNLCLGNKSFRGKTPLRDFGLPLSV